MGSPQQRYCCADSASALHTLAIIVAVAIGRSTQLGLRPHAVEVIALQPIRHLASRLGEDVTGFSNFPNFLIEAIGIEPSASRRIEKPTTGVIDMETVLNCAPHSWAMAASAIAIYAVLALGAAALIKYLFSGRPTERTA